jgi:YfiH family protein
MKGLASEAGLRHFFFTRRGGNSRFPFESLNVSTSVGDDPADVAGNLEIVRAAMGASSVVFVRQNHGSNIAVFDGTRPWAAGLEPEADILMTRQRNVALLVKLADCQGVVLYDPEGALCLVHCGWRGNVSNVLGRAVCAMRDLFGSRPEKLRAAIGPSLGPCCAEFVDFAAIFPSAFKIFMKEGARFDLWAISRAQLVEAGVREDLIESAGICTRCRTDLFFSYRGEGVTGRFCVAAMLL